MGTTDVLSSARLSDDEQHRLEVLQQSLILSDEEREPFDRLARLTRRLLAVDAAMVSLIDESNQVFQGHAGLRPDLAARGRSDLSHSFCKIAVATGERLIIRDARQDPLLRRSPAIEDHDAVAYIGIPLEVAGGVVLGTLCVVHSTPRKWTSEEVALLEELAALALTEIEYRLRRRDMEEIGQLALRLEQPVAELGDVVRTSAHLAEGHERDPRLPRLGDLARSRVATVEAVTQDLVRTARAGTRAVEQGELDVRDVLMRAGELVLSAARSDDLVLDLPDDPVLIRWMTAPMSRALTLLITTGLQYLAPGQQVAVRLREEGGAARVSVHAPGAAVPVGELLRVVGHFAGSTGEAIPVNVSADGGVTRVQNDVASATSTRAATTFEACMPTQAATGRLAPAATH